MNGYDGRIMNKLRRGREAPMIDKRARMRVIIPTTLGPVTVLQLEEDPGLERSYIFCNAASPGHISEAYDMFVSASKGGVIERLYGKNSFLLNLSRQIDTGSSWQLGALLAHALSAAGRLAQHDDPADYAVWVTGAVDVVDRQSRAPNIVGVSEVPSKLALLLADPPREAAIVVWPKANGGDVNEELRKEVEGLPARVLEPSGVGELFEALGLDLPAHKPVRGPARLVQAASLAALGALLFVTFVLAPPWPPYSGPVSAMLLITAIAFPLFSGTPRSRAGDGASRFPKPVIGMLGLLAILYLLLSSLFVYDVPTTRQHAVKGFICTPEAKLIHGDKCPFLGLEELSDASYEAELLWTQGSIAAVKTALVLVWVGSIACLGLVAARLLAPFDASNRVVSLSLERNE